MCIRVCVQQVQLFFILDIQLQDPFICLVGLPQQIIESLDNLD